MHADFRTFSPDSHFRPLSLAPTTPPPPPACLGESPSLCSQLAGVEAGYACFCGSESDLARGRPAPATDCDQICFGHPGQLCGGDGRLGIYEGEEWAGMRGLGEGKSDRGLSGKGRHGLRARPD